MDWTLYGSVVVLMLIGENMAALILAVLANGVALGSGSDKVLAIAGFFMFVLVNKIMRGTDTNKGT